MGGPLFYMPELRKRFVETLKLKPENVIVPNNCHVFVAIGAAFLSEGSEVEQLQDLTHRIQEVSKQPYDKIGALPPLFATEKDLTAFLQRHDQDKVARRDLATFTGKCFLGVDAGSTTTKAALIDENGALLYSYYGSNKGNPLKKVGEILKDLYPKLPEGAELAYTGITGYGEQMLQTAYGFDVGEVETIAHYKAAESFLPGVDFILDIGGQDMKCIRLKDGAIENIMLNEDEEVKNFVGEYEPEHSLLDPECPMAVGPYSVTNYYFEAKRAQAEALKNAKKVTLEVADEYAKFSGRKYGLFEEYKMDDAEFALVLIGSAAGTAKDAVDKLRENGVKAGLIKIRLFRPFPGDEIAKALENVKAVALMDRTESYNDCCGPIGAEVTTALYRNSSKVLAVNYVYGLGGRDVRVEDIESVYSDLQKIAADGKVENPYRYLGVRE